MAVFPAGTFTTPNRVVLIGRGRYEEGVVSSAAVLPGSLVMDDGAGGIKAHNTAGGIAELLFAIEQGLQGIGGSTVPKGAWDTYDVGSQAQFYVAARGDLLNVLLSNGANAAEGNFLTSNGDGTLTVANIANTGGNLFTATADSAAVTNTTTETLFGTSYSIPANFLQAGDVLHVRGQVAVPNQNSTDTLNLKLYVGGLTGTAVCATGAIDVAINDEGLIDAYIEFRTVGGSGTMVANGTSALGTPGTVTAKPFLLASTAVATNAALVVGISATWSVASASDQALLRYFTVDLVRQSGPTKALALVTSAVNNSGGTTGQSYSPSALVQARMM